MVTFTKKRYNQAGENMLDFVTWQKTYNAGARAWMIMVHPRQKKLTVVKMADAAMICMLAVMLVKHFGFPHYVWLRFGESKSTLVFQMQSDFR